MTTPSAAIKIGLDTKALESALSKMNADLKSSFTEINSAFSLLKNAGGTVISVVSGIANAMADLAAEADNAARIQRQANVLLVEQGRLSAGLLAQLNATNDARERALGVSADEQLELQTRLRLAGVHNDQLAQATELAIGLASVTGNDLQSSMRAVEQAYDGNFKALSKLGFEVKNFGDLQQLSVDLFKNAEKGADTYGGALARLGEAIGHVKEQLGSVVTESDGVVSVMGGTSTGIYAVGDAIDFIKPALTWYLDALIKFQLYQQGLGEWQLKAKRAVLGAFSFGSDDPLIDYASIDGRPSMTLADYESYPQSAEGPGPSLWQQAKARLAKRNAAKRKGISLSESDVRGIFDPDDSFSVGSPSNAAFFSDPFFPEAGERKRTVTDDGGEMRDRLKAQYQETQGMSDGLKNLISSTAGAAASGLSNIMGGMIQVMIDGSKSVGEALSEMVGGMIVSIGQLLLQLGTAALVFGALSLIPGFQGITGGPGIGFAAGAAALVAGAGLIAVGSAMGGSGSGSASASGGARGGGGRAGPRTSYGMPGANDGSALPMGLGMGNVVPMNVSVNFNGVVGDPRAAARQIQDVLRQGNLRRAS